MAKTKEYVIYRKATVWEQAYINAETLDQALQIAKSDDADDHSWSIDYNTWELTEDYEAEAEDD